MEVLIYGAGNIGRGFLAKLFRDAGHSVTFVDVNETAVTLINQEHEYPVYVVSSNGVSETVVHDVKAISLLDTERLINAIVGADFVLTAVGKNALGGVAATLAVGLLERQKRRPTAEAHIVVVACENVADNTRYLGDLLAGKLGPAQAKQVLETVSLPNCVVDRIVPNAKACEESSPLAVTVEEYFQLVIDAEGLKQDFPAVPGIQVASNLPALLVQKLCTLNMAHAIVAYYGYLRQFRYIHEAIADPLIRELLKGALLEVESVIVGEYGISHSLQLAYGIQVIERFENPYLQDEVVRVARDPLRKLGPDDRLIKPAVMAMAGGILPAHLSTGIAAALHYDFGGDPSARQLTEKIKLEGVSRVFEAVTAVSSQTDLARMVASNYWLRAL